MTPDTITGDLKAKADEARGWMEQAQRGDDPEATFYRFKDEAPEWTRDLSQEAHDPDERGVPRFMPDDYRYLFLADALDAIADADEGDSLAEVRDVMSEPTPYTGQRLAWLASNLNRTSFVDEAVSESAWEVQTDRMNLMDDLAGMGMAYERAQVFDAVAGWLAEAVNA